MTSKVRLTAALLAALMTPSILHAQEAPAKTATPEAVQPKAERTEEEILLDSQVDSMFVEMDRNKNGSVSKIELTSFGVGQGLGVALREKQWKLLDRNRDGKITKDEIRQYVMDIREKSRHKLAANAEGDKPSPGN